MSVFVVRAFVKMRDLFTQNRELTQKLTDLERNLTGRLDDQEQAIAHILDEIRNLMEAPFADSKEIGFHVHENDA